MPAALRKCVLTCDEKRDGSLPEHAQAPEPGLTRGLKALCVEVVAALTLDLAPPDEVLFLAVDLHWAAELFVLPQLS
eukprot:3743656-Rhodomonas_salina.1